MSDLKKLYSEIIRHHNENPFHFQKMEQAPHILKAYNPVCGDRFELYLTSEDNRISQIHFHGFGCAVSKASTSIMVKSLEGKSLQEANTICNDYLGFIQQERMESRPDLADDFKAFSGVHDFPERRECATLSWIEMQKFIQSRIGDTK